MRNPPTPVRRAVQAWSPLALALLAACADPPRLAGPSDAESALRPTPTLAAAIPAGPYVPGQSYFGRNGYVEYIAGNAPVILTAPHGGTLVPDEIPNRSDASCGMDIDLAKDDNVRELARAMQQRYHARYGSYPHVVLLHLRRTKLDANRAIVEAACGDPEAEIAWHEWQDFIGAARASVLAATGKGWYMDIHGHTHTVQRLELGYLLTAKQLDLSDATLDGTATYETTASMQTMSTQAPASFSTLLRGAKSLGTMYADSGYPALPSATDPSPRGAPYFFGNYGTERYTCGAAADLHGGEAGGPICGVQLEANMTGVRDSEANRARFAEVTVGILGEYLSLHWGLQLGGATPPPPPPPNAPPAAKFSASCNGLTCTFADASSDVDGTIVSWHWSFGDGGTSTAPSPSRTYAAEGSYPVARSVTDDSAATGSTSATVTVTAPPPPPPSITLSVRASKVKGNGYADLSWTGATSTSVDVYRNDAKKATTANDGAYRDSLGKLRGTFHYRVCHAGTTTCSGTASVSF